MSISEEEKRKRRRAVDSTIGSHRMDGIEIDEVCRSIMNRFAEGHITMEEMGIAIDIHARALVAEAQRKQAAGELQDSPYTNYVAVEEDAEIQEVVFPDGRRRWFFIDEAKRIS